MPGLYQATIVGALSLLAGFNPVQMTAYAITFHVLQVIPLLFLGAWGLLKSNLSIKGVVQKSQSVIVEQEAALGD
jgi:multisubunit Na+/H+ antiporter MnhE subunit